MPDKGLARRLLKDVTTTDSPAQARARARLLRAIDQDHRHEPEPQSASRQDRVRWFGAAAAIAATFTILLSLLPVRFGEPPTTAAAALRRLSQVAASQPPFGHDATEAFSTTHTELRPETQTVIGQTEFTVITRLEVHTSLGSDGSGRIRTIVQAAYLASKQDEEAWIDAGSPPIPRPGDVRIDHYEPGDLPFYDLDDLPTKATPLRRALTEGELEGFAPESVDDLSVLGTLLAQPNATPALRSALFEIAARIEGVQLIPDATDPVGRAGVGLASVTDSYETRLIVDDTNSAILSITDTPSSRNEEGHFSWVAYTS